jgi:hypothetical protein
MQFLTGLPPKSGMAGWEKPVIGMGAAKMESMARWNIPIPMLSV